MRYLLYAALLVLCFPCFAACPKGAPPADVLWCADISGLPFDEQLFFSSLQGITAQTRPRIYLVREKEGFEKEWAELYIKKGYIKKVVRIEPGALCRRFAKELKGAVVWDGDLSSTVNAACAAASVDRLAVCTPELAERLGLPVKLDLRGRFSRDTEVYAWVMEKYGSRLSRRAVCSLEPTAAGAWLRDYLIQHGIFTFWIRSPKSGIRGGGPGDEAFMQALLKHFPANIPVLGFWQAGDTDEGVTEYGGLKLAGASGKYTVVSDWAPNLSVHSGIPAPGALRQKGPRRLAYDEKQKYVAVTQYESGDCPWFWQRLQRKNWLQEEHGKYPMNWCLGPNTLDLMPGILEWFYANASPLDCFFAAMSGAGYTMLGAIGSPEARKTFLGETEAYMERLDLSVVSVHTDHWFAPPLPKEAYEGYAALSGVKAVLADFGRNETLPAERYAEFCGGVPVIHTQNRWDIATNKTEDLTRDILNARGQFISVMALSWSMGPREIYKALEALPEGYVPVRADEMAQLMEQKKARENDK